MNKNLFAELVESMEQMYETARGERAPSREFHVEPLAIKELRSKLGLSQPKFAKLLHVNVGTLRNWEQGRREPTGLPGRFHRDPSRSDTRTPGARGVAVGAHRVREAQSSYLSAPVHAPKFYRAADGRADASGRRHLLDRERS